MQETRTDENRLLAALGYPIGFVALVVLLTDLKRHAFLRYHAVQALAFIVAGTVVMAGWSILMGVLATMMPFLLPLVFLSPILVLGWIVLTFLYAYRAYQGERFAIPIVGRLAARYAGGP